MLLLYHLRKQSTESACTAAVHVITTWISAWLISTFPILKVCACFIQYGSLIGTAGATCTGRSLLDSWGNWGRGFWGGDRGGRGNDRGNWNGNNGNWGGNGGDWDRNHGGNWGGSDRNWGGNNGNHNPGGGSAAASSAAAAAGGDDAAAAAAAAAASGHG